MPTTKSKASGAHKHTPVLPEAQVKELIGKLQQSATELTDDALRELGRLIIRAQRTPAALTELSGEIRKRKGQLHS